MPRMYCCEAPGCPLSPFHQKTRSVLGVVTLHDVLGAQVSMSEREDGG